MAEFQEEVQRLREIEPYKDRRVTIFYKVTRNSAKYSIRDEGKGFDHSALLNNSDPENLFLNSSKGLLLISNFMHEVFWNERGNEITMIRYRKRNK